MTTLTVNSDITHVEVRNDRVIAAVGNFLYAYTITGDYISKVKVFDHQRIHGFRFKSHDNVIEDDCLIVYGGRFSAIVHIADDLNVAAQQEHDDWLLDGRIVGNETRFITANNVAIIHRNGHVNHVKCPKIRCILYCATIVYERKSWLVLAGTVFSEIVVWNVDVGNILHKLNGHKGVIFSITYSPTLAIITSTSDDRSLCIWSIESNSDHAGCLFHAQSIHLKRSVFAHKSRVWRSKILTKRQLIVTIGEDSVINFTDVNGQLKQRIDTFSSSRMWSLDVNEREDLLIVGYEDGGLIGYYLDDFQNEDIVKFGIRAKKLTLLNVDRICVIGDCGKLSIKNGPIESIFDDYASLKNILITANDNRECLAIAGRSPFVHFIHFLQPTRTTIDLRTFNVICQSILSINWLDSNRLIVCDNRKNVHEVSAITASVRLVGSLPSMAKECMITCVCLTRDHMIAAGDRFGNVHLFDGGVRVRTFSRVHSVLGVCDLMCDGGVLTSVGRDGHITQIHGENSYTTHRLPFNWCAKLIPHLGFIVAFHETNLIVWDYKQNQLVAQYNCNGGHRSWDVFPTNTHLSLAYIKDHCVIRGKLNVTNRVYRRLFHSREINDWILFDHAGKMYGVSGGEDTSVIFSEITNHVEVLRTIRIHKSSVRCISALTLPNYYLVVMGGGRAEIIVWKVVVSDSLHVEQMVQFQVNKIGVNVNAKGEDFSIDPETRIMALDTSQTSPSTVQILCACSDGVLRLYHFSQLNVQTPPTLYKSWRMSKCQLTCKIIDEKFLCTLTDGRICVCTLDGVISVTYAPVINCMVVVNDWIVAGCDDGTVALRTYGLLDVLDVACVHTAQVTGIIFVSNRIITASIDQRVSVFAIENDKFTLIRQCCSSTSDIHGIRLVGVDDASARVLVFGKGYEILEIGLV